MITDLPARRCWPVTDEFAGAAAEQLSTVSTAPITTTTISLSLFIYIYEEEESSNAH